ncbi:hypothetical protein LJ656_22185 [Paraburkholderia sp. MMS20-SJTR3]|uniref:Secreted protein n=1 Tax=Paraburkholderia sejongensis TaxID=2886946 RepID=A0ABS8JZG9_9BURK|nr:hypothetical protein [Paraburkholderia sp. MMS20-SJTR3]MCC8395301.1 hypothetical protein [Paraburkholderia sp. MMS20-SJTR3]
MKKNASMKFLAMIAIMTSATVMQIREHVAPPDPARAAQADSMSGCEGSHGGFAPAACGRLHERLHDQQPVEQRQRAAQPAHTGRHVWV